MNFNVAGGLATYDFYSQYIELAGRMFGAYINYTFNPVTKVLQLVRKPTGGETVVLWCQRIRVDEELLQDPFVRPWIRSYALTWCKTQLGEAYSKFNTIVGPGGGTTLKGAEIKQEAIAEREALERELDLYIDESSPPLIVIG